MKRAISIVAAAFAVGATLTVVNPASAAAIPCGYFEEASKAYYNNCLGTLRTVHVDVIAARDYDQCVVPGRNLLRTNAIRTRGAADSGPC